jgi:hypothetical protein
MDVREPFTDSKSVFPARAVMSTLKLLVEMLLLAALEQEEQVPSLEVGLLV